jgi:hypothetical protein
MSSIPILWLSLQAELNVAQIVSSSISPHAAAQITSKCTVYQLSYRVTIVVPRATTLYSRTVSILRSSQLQVGLNYESGGWPHTLVTWYDILYKYTCQLNQIVNVQKKLAICNNSNGYSSVTSRRK